MKTKRRAEMRLFIAFSLALLVVAAVGDQSTDDEESGFPREVALSGGETVTIPAKPVRICSVTVATDEILLELVGPERIVALSNLVDDPGYSNVIEQAKAVPHRVGSEAEAIIGLKPDLVLVAFYTRAEFVELIASADLPVVRLEKFNTLEDIRTNIRLLGRLTGTEERADELLKLMGAAREDIASHLRDLPQKEVLTFAHGWIAGKGTIYTDIIELAGGRNLAADKGIAGHKQISTEALLEWDPEYILVDGPTAQITHGGKLVAQNPVLANLGAVKEGRVIEIPSAHLFSCASHHIVKGITELARLLHPEAFSEAAPESVPSATCAD